MAALRSSNPNVHPITPTRTPSGQLADAGHVPQLLWQSDGADDYNQPQQLHKQPESNDDAKSAPSRGRHVSHDTDTRYGWFAPDRWCSPQVELFPELILLQTTERAEHCHH